jgi:beta-glucuronidase
MAFQYTRSRTKLSGKFWLFQFGLSKEELLQGKPDPGIENKWYETGIPRTAQRIKVFVPCPWNLFLNRKNFEHFGTGWYQTSFFAPHDWGTGDGKRITLVFNGSNYITKVWINGKFVGEHEGGFTQFWFDIHDFLNYGGHNLMVIQIDNAYGEGRLPWFTVPEYMNYGGIHRAVYIKATPSVSIEDYKLANRVVFTEPVGKGTSNAKAFVKVNLHVKDYRNYPLPFEGVVVIVVTTQTFYKSVEIPIEIHDQDDIFLEKEIEIENPVFWELNQPHLYSFEFILLDEYRNRLDNETARWGIKDFSVLNGKFYLNNKQIILTGVNRHEDHPETGNSIPKRIMYDDLNIMKEANINCFRICRYPNDEGLLELADEMGFLVFEDFPIQGLTAKEFKNPKMLINAQRQSWEMIHRDKNHTCIIGWVHLNDCDTTCPEAVEFVKELYEIGKEIDPTRLHLYISNNPKTDLCLKYSDIIALGNISSLEKRRFSDTLRFAEELNEFRDLQQQKPDLKDKLIMIAEFGISAVANYKSFEHAYWSENLQMEHLKQSISVMRSRPWIAGGFISYFHDYRCSPVIDYTKRPLEYENSGILDKHRNPKLAYFVVEELFELWQSDAEK